MSSADSVTPEIDMLTTAMHARPKRGPTTVHSIYWLLVHDLGQHLRVTCHTKCEVGVSTTSLSLLE
jgi:hypothetical protein